MIPPAIDPIVQRSGYDCALAALAMASTLPYSKISEAALKVCKEPHARGLWTSEMRKVMKAVGFRVVVVKPPIVFDHGCGVLIVSLKRGDDHCVTVYHDLIIDPQNGLIWEPDAYLESEHARMLSGLIIEPIRPRTRRRNGKKKK
jgi:ABC-type bacteriocin/lantibiotic exporter with double-glycine peptidase domain